MANIFISYNRESEQIVRVLADDIEALGHTAWFDQELSGGHAWWDKILDTIRSCDVFVFALSPAALESVACSREYHYAAALGKAILPVQIAEGISTNLLPPLLSQIQFVDYRKQDRETALRLGRALTNIPPPRPLPDPLPTPPAVPLSYLGGLTEQIDTQADLSYETQSTLLLDLKRGLRNPETGEDARKLLIKLRHRRDLLVTVADEIDELLASPEVAAGRKKSAPEPASKPAQPAPVVQDPLPDNKTPQPPIQPLLAAERGKNWMPTLVVVGGLIAALLLFILLKLPDVTPDTGIAGGGKSAPSDTPPPVTPPAVDIPDQRKQALELRKLSRAVDEYYAAIAAKNGERVRMMWKDPTSSKAQRAYDLTVQGGGVCSVLDDAAAHSFNSAYSGATLSVKVKCDETAQGFGMRHYTMQIRFEKNYADEWRIVDLKGALDS